MNDGLKKFFDPQSIPKEDYKAIAVDYFEKIRHKLRLSFAFPNNPEKILHWDDPEVEKSLFDFKAKGGSEILVKREQYEQKIKELADSKL